MGIEIINTALHYQFTLNSLKFLTCIHTVEQAGATQPWGGLLLVSLHPEQLDGAPDPPPIPTDSQSLPVLPSIFLKQTQAAQPRVTHAKEDGKKGFFSFQEEKGLVYTSFTLSKHSGYGTRQVIYLFLDRQLIGYFSSSVCYAWSAVAMVTPSYNRSWFRWKAQRSLWSSSKPQHTEPRQLTSEGQVRSAWLQRCPWSAGWFTKNLYRKPQRVPSEKGKHPVWIRNQWLLLTAQHFANGLFHCYISETIMLNEEKM